MKNYGKLVLAGMAQYLQPHAFRFLPHLELRCPRTPQTKKNIPYLQWLRATTDSVNDSVSGEGQSVLVHGNNNHAPGIDLILSRLEKMDKQISSLKEELRQTRANTGSGIIAQATPVPGAASPFVGKGSTLPISPGKHFVEDATGATIFLGSHSDPPVALGCRQAGSDPMLNDATLLDQLVPRTYPFTNLWKQEPGAGEICETLPDESDIIRYVSRPSNERLSLRLT